MYFSRSLKISTDPESCEITCSDPSGTQFLLNRTLPDAYTCQRDSLGNDVPKGICINGRCEVNTRIKLHL